MVESNARFDANDQFVEEYESPTKSEDIVDTDDLNCGQSSEVNKYYYECDGGKRDSGGTYLMSQRTHRQPHRNIPFKIENCLRVKEMESTPRLF